jgi:integrase
MGRKSECTITTRDGRGIQLRVTFGGIRYQKTISVNGKSLAANPRNEKYAQRLAEEINTKIRAGAFVPVEYFPDTRDTAAPLTVGDQLGAWLAAQRVEHSTKAGYGSALRFWKAAQYDTKDAGAKLGELPLRSLKLSHILTAVASRPTLSGKTINNYLSVLRPALALAVEDKILAENPAEKVPDAAHQKPPPDPFSKGEAERIIADMARHYPEPVVNLVEFWVFTGLRTSELVGLRWGNVDLASGTVMVVEGIVRRQAKDKTKTGQARHVRLNPRALAALQRQRAHTQMAGDLVFLRPVHGRRGPAPTSPAWANENAFATYWRPTLRRLGIRYRRPYCCRHTYATMMLMAGARPAWCAKQMGHSVRVFHEDYAKWIDGQRDDAEMALVEAFIGNQNGNQNRGSAG